MAASEVVHHCGLPGCWPSLGRHRSLRRRQIGWCLGAAGSSICEQYLLVGSTLHDKILEGSVILDKVDERPVIIFAGTNLCHVCRGWSKLIMVNLSVNVFSILQLRCVMVLWHDISVWRIGLGLNSITLPA